MTSLLISVTCITSVAGLLFQSDRRTFLDYAASSAVAAAAAAPSGARAAGTHRGLWLGTCCDEDLDNVERVVYDAIDAGFREIDTATHYGNEEAIGAAIRKATQRGVIEQAVDVRVLTKVWFDDMTYEATKTRLLASQASLGPSLHCALIHFPGTIDAIQSPKENARRRAETWRALEDLKAEGILQQIGVSNYVPRHARELLKSGAEPDIVQLECHPYCANSDLADLWRAAGVPRILGYSPFASGRLPVLSDPAVRAVAVRHGKDTTAGQVVLAWLRQRGVEPVVKATTRLHLREDLGALVLRLEAEEMAMLGALDRGESVAFDSRLMA